MIDLSVCLPAIRPSQWMELYNSLKLACAKHTFELVLISPYNLPKEMRGLPNVKHIKDFGSATRATMLGSNFCSGKYIAVPADDGYFFPSSFDAAIDQLEKAKPDDIVVLRYREGSNKQGKEFPADYWYARNHIPVRELHIDDDWKHATQPLMRTDFFRQIGGFDCNFEHLAFAAHDLSYRAQRSGSICHLSKLEVMNADYFAGTTGDHTPVHNGHTQQDHPLFMSMYRSPNVVGRKNIDVNNWRYASTSWVRRFPARSKYTLSICVPGIRPQFWKQVYDTAIVSAREHPIQIVFVGPYEPLEEILDNPNVKFLKDFGSPTRCVHIGSMLCEGDLFMWSSDDGMFESKALKRAIEAFYAVNNPKDEMIMRYTEGSGRSGTTPPDDYWRIKHHADNRDLAIPDDTLLAPLGMLKLSYFRELGGFDCGYEHINLSTHDLAIRIQKNGGKLHKSPECVAAFDWDPNAKDYQPVRDSYHMNDLPLLKKHYKEPNDRILIDFDNWRLAPERWRRFK